MAAVAKAIIRRESTRAVNAILLVYDASHTNKTFQATNIVMVSQRDHIISYLLEV